MAVMGGDDIVVGYRTSIRKSSQSTLAQLGAPASAFVLPADKPSALKTDRPESRPSVCGEMSQQCGHNSTQSTPQKFLRLVGCRDRNAGPPVKR
jgi:hypothetical protein